MAARRNRVTREAILETAARLISETGAASLTFQTLGDTLGVSKQAIIYWFPSKADLTRALVIPALELEADAVGQDLEGDGQGHGDLKRGGLVAGHKEGAAQGATPKLSGGHDQRKTALKLTGCWVAPSLPRASVTKRRAE